MLHSTSSASVLILLRLGSHGGTRGGEDSKPQRYELRVCWENWLGVCWTVSWLGMSLLCSWLLNVSYDVTVLGSVVQLGMVNEKDYREDPQDYNHGIPPLKRSEPNIPVDVLLEATKPIHLFPWDSETDLICKNRDFPQSTLEFELFKQTKRESKISVFQEVKSLTGILSNKNFAVSVSPKIE
ncbi:unnamed protein product [Vicia faba]|uniref:Uncharacterized protein n=1 Tax=Vicia faba TaxID=3906 RepID=A0AAV1AWV4_VICFA|nr:unnamed protein product [Vicia faba]